jgi:alanine racemase
MSGGRPIAARIDRAALRANLACVRARAPGRRVLAVVKADAYGHGAVDVARTLAEAGVEGLAVLTVAEAAELRAAGLSLPILVMAGVHDAGEAREALSLRLEPVIHHAGGLELASKAAAAAGAVWPVQVELDTGMRRMGAPPGQAVALLSAVAAGPSVRLAGVFTHLARADEPDLGPAREQLALFARILADARARGVDPGSVHVAASAGLLAWPGLSDAAPATDAVRPGILLYGSNPCPHLAVEIAPVMTLATRVVHLREVARGDAVGYGALWRAPRAGRVATLAAGYADGVPRCLGEPGRPPGQVLIGNRRFPVAGRVSMDYLTVDLGADANAVSLGDEAILFGRSARGEWLPADAMAAAAGTLSYELFVRVGARVRRELCG